MASNRTAIEAWKIPSRVRTSPTWDEFISEEVAGRITGFRNTDYAAERGWLLEHFKVEIDFEGDTIPWHEKISTKKKARFHYPGIITSFIVKASASLEGFVRGKKRNANMIDRTTIKMEIKAVVGPQGDEIEGEEESRYDMIGSTLKVLELG